MEHTIKIAFSPLTIFNYCCATIYAYVWKNEKFCDEEASGIANEKCTGGSKRDDSDDD